MLPIRSLRLDFDAGVVAPLLGIADLVADHGQLFFGGLLGVVAHPGQRLDVVAQRFFERGNQLVHAVFGRGREVLLDPVLTHGFAECAIGHAGALLPARFRFLLAAESFREEVEVLVKEGFRQQAGLSVQHVPAQIALPGVDRLAGNEAAESLEEVRRADVQRVEVADADLLEVRVPVEGGRQLVKVGDACRCGSGFPAGADRCG